MLFIIFYFCKFLLWAHKNTRMNVHESILRIHWLLLGIFNFFLPWQNLFTKFYLKNKICLYIHFALACKRDWVEEEMCIKNK